MHKSFEKALSVKNLTYYYDQEIILENLNFDIYSGEFVSLIGPSGSGKTTLLNIISGLITPNQGTVLYNNLETNRLGKFTYVHQQDTLLPWRNALDNVLIGLEIKGERKRTSIIKAMDLFEEFGLSDSIYKMPWQLSGGMKQRVLIAIAICCNPEIIVADEPTTSLDSNIQRTIVELLMDLCSKNSISIIWITHNIKLAKYVSGNIAIMYGGKIVEYGKKEEITSNPKHPYTIDLLNISELKNYKKNIKLKTIEGSPYNFSARKETCVYLEKCSKKIDSCDSEKIEYIEKQNSKYLCIHE